MKNLFISFLCLCCFTTAFSQTVPALKRATTSHKTVAVTAVPAKSNSPKTATTAKPTTVTNAVAPLKKDGTADMRYKANKAAAKPVIHTKKDGSADKRFKENKKN